MPSVVNTDISAILVTVNNALLTAGITNYVYLSLTPTVFWNPPDDTFIVIAPSRQVLDQSSTSGGGRDWNFIMGQFTVTVYCRLAVDRYPENTSYLTDDTYGVLAKAKCIINTLQVFVPMDDDGNTLAVEPFRLISMDAGGDRVHLPGWAAIILLFEANYQQDLSCTASKPGILTEGGGFVLLE